MNYLHQIKQFWLIHEAESLSTDEIAFYFYVLEICNKLNWLNPFKRNNNKIQADLSIKSYDKLSAIRKRLREVGLIEFETQNGHANVIYQLHDLSILSKGREGGLPQGASGGFSEVHRKVSGELSKVKTKDLNLNKEKDSSATDSLALYQKFQNFFEANLTDLVAMIAPTQLKTSSREDINAVMLKCCNFYEEQKRISLDFEKNKTALSRWFSKEKIFQNDTKPSAAIPKKSKEDQFREKGLYD